MKRKIQLKKKIIYDFGKIRRLSYSLPYKYQPIFFEFRRIYLLKALFFNKNYLRKNFTLFSYLIKNLKRNREFFFYFNFFNGFSNILIINPLFFFKKQFFCKNIEFLCYLNQNSLFGFLTYKTLMKSGLNEIYNTIVKNNLTGYNFFITNFKQSDLNKISKLKLTEILESDKNSLGHFFDIKLLFNNFKIIEDVLNENDFYFNNFINFNVFLLNIFEIYKILQILNYTSMLKHIKNIK